MKGIDQEIQPEDYQLVFKRVKLIPWKSGQIEKVKMPKSSKITPNYTKADLN